jgi:hypothetical protein
MRSLLWLTLLVVVGLSSLVGCAPAPQNPPPTAEDKKKLDEEMRKAAEKNKQQQ